MEQRFLGRSGMQVSSLALGLMTFGGGEGKFGAIGNVSGVDARRIVDLAIDRGVTLFDTSDNYSAGQSEEIFAQALGGRRKNILIATKAFGRTGRGAHDIGLSRHHLISACEASLKRLNTEWIDLYQVHNHDSLVPMEETLAALDELVRAGKVRYIGCSNHFAWQLVKALGLSALHGWNSYQSQQILYSLLYRHAENELLPAGSDRNIGSLIYSPLAQGYLTGKFAQDDSKASRLAITDQLHGVDNDRARKIVQALIDVAASHEGASPGQVALAWLLARPGVTSLIIGARTPAQLEDNLRACELTLTREEHDLLEQVSAIAPTYPRTAQNVFHPERNPPVFAQPARKKPRND